MLNLSDVIGSFKAAEPDDSLAKKISAEGYPQGRSRAGLRRFPVFPVAGGGNYRLQPVFVDDVARLAVDSASADGNVTLDAVGPETFTFRERLLQIRQTAGGRARLLSLPPALAYTAAALAGFAYATWF